MSELCDQRMQDIIYNGEQQMNAYEEAIEKLEKHIDALKAHAVEVVAKEIGFRKACAWGDIISSDEYLEMWNRESCGKFRDTCRAEARALLGWEE